MWCCAAWGDGGERGSGGVRTFRRGSELAAERSGDHLRLGVDVQLLVDVLDVESDGVDGNGHAIGQELITQAVDEPDHDFLLPRREFWPGWLRLPSLFRRKILHDL